MPGTPMWRNTPRGRRTITDLAKLVTQARGEAPVVLLVGAGVDAALRGRPLWAGLMKQLAETSGLSTQAEALKDAAYAWPAESAEALRITVGPRRFGKSLRLFAEGGVDLGSQPIAEALSELIEAGVRVIVNFNYTTDFIESLEAIRRPSVRRLRLIERAHLESWNFRNLLAPPVDTAHVIALHGLIERSTYDEARVVLDQRSYEEVLLADPNYVHFLKRLFQEATVLSFGLSWGDLPLRSAAAQVLFEFPIATALHAAVLTHGEPAADHWKERGMLGAYSVRPLYYHAPGNDHREAVDLLRDIAQPLHALEEPAPWSDTGFREIADRLDDWGDYESAQQADWMWLNWKTAVAQVQERAVRTVPPTAETWLAMARIERHLRHFIWFYEPDGRARTTLRFRTWERVAQAWTTLGRVERAALWSETGLLQGSHHTEGARALRGILEYAIGAHEVYYGAPGSAVHPFAASWRGRLRKLAATDPGAIVSRRIGIAQKVWRETASPELGRTELRRLHLEAAACYWEGMEAKLTLDMVQRAFPRVTRPLTETAENAGRYSPPRKWSEAKRTLLLGQAEHARLVSRAGGYFRREVGAVVVASVLAPTTSAEAMLIAIFERFMRSGARQKELSTIWWIYVGLLGIFWETHRDRNDVATARLWLERRCGTLYVPSASEAIAVRDNVLPHFARFHLGGARLAAQLLRSVTATV